MSPEKPNDAPLEQEKPTLEKREEKEARRPTHMELLRTALKKLEESDIAEDLKKRMDGWLLKNIKDPAARQAYVERVKERGKELKIAELLEAMADTYLGAHPDMNVKLQANKAELLPQALEGMFDVLFQDALGVNDLSRKELDEVERLLARFKEILK